jgi:hypothetical protein
MRNTEANSSGIIRDELHEHTTSDETLKKLGLYEVRMLLLVAYHRLLVPPASATDIYNICTLLLKVYKQRSLTMQRLGIRL